MRLDFHGIITLAILSGFFFVCLSRQWIGFLRSGLYEPSNVVTFFLVGLNSWLVGSFSFENRQALYSWFHHARVSTLTEWNCKSGEQFRKHSIDSNGPWHLHRSLQVSSRLGCTHQHVNTLHLLLFSPHFLFTLRCDFHFSCSSKFLQFRSRNNFLRSFNLECSFYFSTKKSWDFDAMPFFHNVFIIFFPYKADLFYVMFHVLLLTNRKPFFSHQQTWYAAEPSLVSFPARS